MARRSGILAAIARWLVVLAVAWPAAASAQVPAAPGATSSAEPPLTGRLTDATRAWLRGHRVLSVGVVPEWPPIDGVDAAGAEVGVSADVMARVAQVLGVQLKVVRFDDFSAALAAAAAGRVDVLPSVARTPQREQSLGFTQSYLELPVVYIGRRDVGGFTESGDFGGRRIAVERGYPMHEWLLQAHPHARVLVVDNTLDALRAVAQGRADLYRGALTPAHYLIERELLANLEVLASDQNTTTALSLATASVPAREALDAALDRIGTADLKATAGRWQPQYLALTPAFTPVVPSAGAVAALGEVRVAYDQNFTPISAVASDGTATGLGPALFRRLADGIGMHYRLIPKPSFALADAALRRGEADVVIAAVRTPERERYASFVGPYYSEPAAIISRLGNGWPSLGSLAGHRLAIDADHYLIPVVERALPSVRLVVVHTAAAVLQAVDDGEADAGITNVEVAAAQVERQFVGRLQVSGLVQDDPSELSFMVRVDRPELARALQAGYDAVPINERRVLANTLLRTNVQVGVRWRDVALVATPVLGVLIGLLMASMVYAGRLRRVRTRLQAERDQASAAAAARKDFIAELGHDVRTPLAAIASGLQLLGRQALPGQATGLAASLAQSAERTVGLLNRLLDAARMDAGHFELHRRPTDLEHLVRECVAVFAAQAAERGTTLAVRVPVPLPTLLMDPSRTQQVVNNLVSNAVKFTTAGTVTVEISGRRLDSGVWTLRLDVADTGIGMDEAQTRTIFERFAQGPGSHEHYGGSGLGLAICAQIVRNAGGRMEVHSEPGKGSRFTVRIPCEQAPDARGGAGRQALRVLMADDDPVCRIVLGAQLAEAGFAVDAVEDPDAALQRLAGDGYDVLVTDVSMRDEGDGLRLARQAAGLGLQRLVRVVALSGQDAPAPLPEAVDLWLAKPGGAADRAWLAALCADLGVDPPASRER